MSKVLLYGHSFAELTAAEAAAGAIRRRGHVVGVRDARTLHLLTQREAADAVLASPAAGPLTRSAYPAAEILPVADWSAWGDPAPPVGVEDSDGGGAPSATDGPIAKPAAKRAARTTKKQGVSAER